jgi:hypothetical protein
MHSSRHSFIGFGEQSIIAPRMNTGASLESANQQQGDLNMTFLSYCRQVTKSSFILQGVNRQSG